MSKLLLVSDYDGTLKSNIKNLKINIEAVNRFRDNGNLFAISTGRSYRSIKSECIKYNIEYDFLFCNDGVVLFDSNDNIIYQKTIDLELLLEINSIIENYKGINAVEFHNAYDKTDLVLDNSIIEVFFKLGFLNSYSEMANYIESKFPNLKSFKYLIFASLKKKMDKGVGLEILADKLSLEIDKDNIITVGDNFNDLSMLKKFNGYRLKSSYPFLYGKGLKTTREVHTLIKKIENR